MKRRAFLQSLLRTAAIIALAPRIAFRAPEETFYGGIQYRSNMIGVREQLRRSAQHFDGRPQNSLEFQKFLNTVFAVSRNRERQESNARALHDAFFP